MLVGEFFIWAHPRRIISCRRLRKTFLNRSSKHTTSSSW